MVIGDVYPTVIRTTFSQEIELLCELNNLHNDLGDFTAVFCYVRELLLKVN